MLFLQQRSAVQRADCASDPGSEGKSTRKLKDIGNNGGLK